MTAELHKTGLYIWEQKTVPIEDMQKSMVNAKHSKKLFWALACVFIGIISLLNLTPVTFIFFGLFSLCMARLISVDFTHMILPNIYILICFIAVGVYHALNIPAYAYSLPSPMPFLPMVWFDILLGLTAGLMLPLIVAFIAKFSGEGGLLGGGDIKLIMLAGFTLGFQLIFIYMLTAGLLTFGLILFRKETEPLPMGPALGFALWLFMLLGQQNTFFMLPSY